MDTIHNRQHSQTLGSSFKSLKLTSLAPISSNFSNSICNLHPNLVLNASLASLLQKGLKFIPNLISEPNIISLHSFVNKFIHKLEWASFFHFKSRATNPPFSQSKDSILPANKINPHITQLTTNLQRLVANLNYPLNPSGTFNLSSGERKCINFIKINPSIIIHPADKGGNIVIQSRDDYIFEARRQLNDAQVYKPISAPIYLQTAKIIKRIVDNLLYQGFICKSQHRFLLPPAKPRQRHFYILPKIHKPLDKWTVPNFIPSGRPIVSGCNSESAAVEHFIDFYLQPIASSSPSFIRDSNHFKSFISNYVVKDTDIFVTLDVESLYTNIPIAEGLDCISQAFVNHPSPNRPDNYIKKLIEVTLYRNDFQFSDVTYLQVKGTAMGKKYAPSFANIYMHFWEMKAISLSPQKPLLWKRYIDDIFFIWPFSCSDLVSFILLLNSVNSNIKLTSNFSNTQINFLDCTVFKDNFNSICTKIFFKESDNHNVLHPSSFHPAHTFKGIIKAQILRFIRLSSFHKDFHASFRILKKALIIKGYSRTLIRKCKSEAFQLVGLSSNSMIAGCTPCTHKQCNICKYINNIKFIQGNNFNSQFLIAQNTSCNTNNCIYSIHCTFCTHLNTLYVGETKNTFRDRLNQHLSDIRCKKDTPISVHFNLPNHSISNLKATVIQFFIINKKYPNRFYPQMQRNYMDQ